MAGNNNERVQIGELDIAGSFHEFVEKRLLPGTQVEAGDFWRALGEIVSDYRPANQSLLDERDQLQEQIDAWHKSRAGERHDLEAYKQMLSEIGYLAPETGDFEVSTANVDPEISEVAGPQLVVPLDNSRFVLNAANARWGSLYDALYSTDAIPESEGCAKSRRYNPIRGDRVIAYVRDFLESAFWSRIWHPSPRNRIPGGP